MFQILSKVDSNTIMETLDQEVSVTCVDLSHVKKTFQLALLCTKQNPIERPTMHEVARVLISLLPLPVTKPWSVATKTSIDSAKFVNDKGQNQPKLLQQQQQQPFQPESSSSRDAQWFVRFGDVLS